MFCKECGNKIENNSLFCSQCGTKVESIASSNEDVAINANTITECENSFGSTIENLKKDKINLNEKKMKIPVILSLCAVLVLIYLIYFNFALEEALNLYYSGEYYKAGQKVKYLINITFDERYEKINIAEQLGSDFASYQTSKKIASDSYPFNYEYGLRRLIDGFKECVDFEENHKNSSYDYLVEDFKEKYLEELESGYGIAEYKANQLAKLDMSSLVEEIKVLAPKGQEKQEEAAKQQAKQEYLDKNPIEFTNLGWDSNSLYTIATGSVTNIGNKTVKFVTIKVSFKDKNGNVIDTDSTYAVGSEGLEPGESSKWTASVDRDYSIESYSVSVLDFDYE